MKTYLFLIYVAVQFTIAQSCASSATEKNVEEKVSQEPLKLKRADLAIEAYGLIDKNANLSSEQKTKLKAILENSKKRSDELAETSLQLRAVLLKDVVASPYDENEVNIIKKKITKVEQERLSVFFEGVHETNRTLGRWGSANERNNFYQWFTIDPSSTSF